MKRIVGAFSLVLLCSLSVYSQNNKIIYDEYGPIYTSMNDSIIVYNTKEGKQLEVKLNQVSFKDGDDYLKEYLKKNWYKSNYNDDYSYRVYFFILFNSNLKIKEVRGTTLPLSSYSESKKKRIKTYTKGLKRTKSKWEKVTNQKWYVYCFSFVTD